jgi:hypothetical protein
MMDNWLIFQLVVDAALLVVVVLLALRDGKPRADLENRPSPALGVNLVEVEVLIEELGKLVARAEQAADRMEKGITSTGHTPPTPSTNHSPKPDTRSAPPDSGSVLDDEPYVKASRLIKKGMTDEEVGRKVGLPPPEVNLIRKMMK